MQAEQRNAKLCSQKQVGITIDRGIISANSNLNYERLEKMLSNFEMTASPKLQEQKPIIEKLVWYIGIRLRMVKIALR